MRYTIIKSLCAMLLLSATGTSLYAAEDNPVYNELVNRGIALSNGKTIKLPEPVMADDMKKDDQQSVLKQIGPKNKGNMQQFLRGNPTDWYEIKQSSEKGATDNDSIGRRVDLYFVAKGKLATVANPDFIKQQIQRTKQKKVDNYTDDELKSRKLTVKTNERFIEKYTHGKLTPDDLFGKVQVEGSAHGIETLSPESIFVAFKLDPRFNKDATYPNQYQTAKPGPNGNVVLGPTKPYTGFGGYAKITKLEDSEDKIFVEYHIVFDEPHDWFNGTAELASKLETNYTENIRKFRRDVSK